MIISQKIDDALNLARRGFKVFPLTPNSKIPLKGSRGYLDATTSDIQIKEWWNQDPNRNIGIATGDGLFVLDVDSPSHNGNGIDGFKTLSDFESINGKLPETYTVLTPTGGRHLYYLFDDPSTCGTNILQGVDYRNNGGYVVGPGSTINGKDYEVINNIPMNNDSAALEPLKKLLAAHKEFNPIEIKNNSNLIPVGQRQDYLKHEISKLYDETLSKVTLKAILRAINSNQLAEPLSEKELENTLDKMIDKVSFKPHLNKNKTEVIKDISLELASNITTQEVEWLVPGYIPKNTITLLVGDGDTGKSSLASNIAAALSNGIPSIFSDIDDTEVFPIGSTMILTSEECVSVKTVPRLRDYGADLNKIILTDKPSVLSDLSIGGINFENIIAKHKPTLCILDPLQQFLKDVNMWSRNEMRQAMTHLNSLCENYNTTFLIIMHTNKRDNVESARSKVSDSADIYDFARSVLMVGKVSNEERFVSLEKKNLNGPDDPDETILWKFGNKCLEKIGKSNLNYTQLHKSDQSMTKEERKTITRDYALEVVKDKQPIPLNELRDILTTKSNPHLAKTITNNLISEGLLIKKTIGIRHAGVKQIITLPDYEYGLSMNVASNVS